MYGEMLKTAELAGINIIGMNRAAQILATVFLYGDESAVYSERLRTDITHIIQKYNLFGTGKPNHEIVAKINRYVSEIKQSADKPEWLKLIEKNYSITFPEYKECKISERQWREECGLRLPKGINRKTGRG